MYHRHKVPTIFNIYMLDVICCALGCVVLLWQVAHQEAEEQTAKAKDSNADALKQSADAVRARDQYEKAQRDFLSASSDVTVLQAAIADWQKKHQLLEQLQGLTEKEREDARKLAAARQDSLDKTRSALTLSAEQLKKLETELAKLLAEQKKTNADLTGEKKISAELLAKILALKSESAKKQTELAIIAKKSNEQGVALKLSEENARKLEELLDALRVEQKDTQAKLKLAELQLKIRDQDVSAGAKTLLDAKTLIAALTTERDQWKAKLAVSAKEKDKLNQRVVALQAEADQRFAGIPLTGENVVFLIDISGSMTMKDEVTEDPDKWPFLCETLMKLMRSIPTLQRFQVILFSDKTSYLFGNRDVWLKYDGPETARQTRDALRKVKVDGGTNMQDAFDEAFRYRKLKLDTIYLFSDGLPNIGEGVPAALKNPTEAQRNFHMAKFVREKLKNDWNRPQPGLSDVRINAVGFFFESPDVGAFLWAMAREHRGAFVGLR